MCILIAQLTKPMKLYATITNSKGKTEGMGDDEKLTVDFSCKNKKLYTVNIYYENVGDIEKPTMDAILTVRDWRKDEGNKPKGE